MICLAAPSDQSDSKITPRCGIKQLCKTINSTLKGRYYAKKSYTMQIYIYIREREGERECTIVVSKVLTSMSSSSSFFLRRMFVSSSLSSKDRSSGTAKENVRKDSYKSRMSEDLLSR